MVPQVIYDPVHNGSTWNVPHAEGLRDQLGHKLGVGEHRQVDQPYTLRVQLGHICRHPQGEACFATSSSARQSKQPRRPEKPSDLVDLVLTTDEERGRGWQIVRPGGNCVWQRGIRSHSGGCQRSARYGVDTCLSQRNSPPGRCRSQRATTLNALATIVSAGFDRPARREDAGVTMYRLSASSAWQLTSSTLVEGSVPKRHVPPWWATPASGIRSDKYTSCGNEVRHAVFQPLSHVLQPRRHALVRFRIVGRVAEHDASLRL